MTTEKEKLVEPPPHKREYFRKSGPKGELGWAVTVDGKKCVRMDRGSSVRLILPWNNGQGWVSAMRFRPLVRAQIVQVAFEADRKLCSMIGKPKEASKSWQGLSTRDRKEWLKQGPPGKGVRKELFREIVGLLEEEGV